MKIRGSIMGAFLTGVLLGIITVSFTISPTSQITDNTLEENTFGSLEPQKEKNEK